jgi:hypothetical protein
MNYLLRITVSSVSQNADLVTLDAGLWSHSHLIGSCVNSY